MNNFYNNGSTFSFTAVGAHTAGAMYVVNGISGVKVNGISAADVADSTIPADKKIIVVNLDGVYNLPVDAGSGAIASEGVILYTNATNDKVTTDSSLTRFGTSMAAASGGNVLVNINKYFV